MVEIVLAVYNGRSFLEEQLSSLFAQTYDDWRLLVRDDVSTDGSREYLAEVAGKNPGKIIVLPCNGERLGPGGNFSRLLEASTADHVFMCDQDDVWLPDKIETTLQLMMKLETEYGVTTPLLVYTDATVVGAKLEPLDPSLLHYQRTDASNGAALNRLLLQNVVTGCTAAVNRSLLREALPIPTAAIMHDWWLALVAATLGRMVYLNVPTILYRQHAANSAGAIKLSAAYALGRLATIGAAREEMKRTRKQAAALYEKIGGLLEENQQKMLNAYAVLGERTHLERRFDLLRYGFRYHGCLRNVGLFFLA